MLANPRDRMQGLISEADPDFENLATPEMKNAVRLAKKAAKLTEEQAASNAGLPKMSLAAKYKIEITFIHGRRLHGDNKCGIQIWESGKKLHGGGDQLMFVCVDTQAKKPEGCGGFISADDIQNGIAFCKKCMRQINANRLGVFYAMNAPAERISAKLVELFRHLDSNCDIYLKFAPDDVRYKAMAQAKGKKVADRLKGMAIYPLSNIILDVSAGADLGKRFKAFITS
jgi:hypothetical protein